jgi:type IV pilus assembly protein PilN
MIKINLLGVAQPTARPAGPPPTVARQVLIFGISAVVCALVVLFFWRIWSTEIARLNEEKVKQQREAERLAQIRAENQRYLTQRQQLERRINTIQQLQQGRVGPVDMMIHLGNVVNRTNDLYLLTVSPEGARIAIRGQSNTVHSIANFIADLKNSGGFQDVQLRQYYQDDQFDRLSFKFNLDCAYQLPAVAPPPGAGQQAAAPAAPGRPAGL